MFYDDARNFLKFFFNNIKLREIDFNIRENVFLFVKRVEEKDDKLLALTSRAERE